MNFELLEKLRKLKIKYNRDGFIIIGVFGSCARGEETQQSDIDILYCCEDRMLQKYPGWEFLGYYNKVKAELEKELGRKVDLADETSLNKIGRKYILPELIHVT